MSVPLTNPPLDRTTVLQSKLYQAAKRDPSRRFHALYDKLHLEYVLTAAWEQVRKTRGAAGIDQQTLESIQEQGVAAFLAEIAQALREKTYRPVPVRRVHLPKGGGKTRPLGIPTVRDRVVQAAAKLLLEPIFEADFEGTPSFGFRPDLGPQEALEAVRAHSRNGYQWVVDADIEQFFDRLDHQQLMTALRRRISDGEVLRLIYRWLKAGYVWEGSYHDTDQGSPQGGVLSPLLANIYLHGFDREQGTTKVFLGRLTRYADDFVIQCGTAQHAQRALEWVRERLAALGLTLHPEKTRVLRDDQGFDFLGFRHQRVVLRSGRPSWGVIRWPGRKAQQRFRDRIRQLCRPARALRAEWSQRVAALRRFLIGWCQYYRHGASTAVFWKLDQYVAERLARSYARSQPTGKGRKPRSWRELRRRLWNWPSLPRLQDLQQHAFRAYRGQANVQWRAV